MNASTQSRPTGRPIKGSWEDLFNQARQHARNYNDEAIPLFRRVFDGLAALPASARDAGDKRLYHMMTNAGVELHGYLNVVDRHEEALAVLDKLRELLPENEKDDLLLLRSNVLLAGDRADDAVKMLHDHLAGDKVDPADYGHLISVLIKLKRYEDAANAVDDMANWIETQAQAGELTGDDLASTLEYQRRLRVAVLLESGKVEEALAGFEEIYKRGGAGAFSPQLIYTLLIKMGLYDDAVKVIDRDQARPARQAFWRGLVAQYQGDTTRAQRIWDTMTREQFVAKDQNSVVEHVLALYYLGDPKREGLEIVLNAMRERQTDISWILFYLAGLGWAMRGDYGTAASNFKLAQSQLKSAAESKVIPNQYWRFLHDLVPAESARFAHMFETGESA